MINQAFPIPTSPSTKIQKFAEMSTGGETNKKTKCFSSAVKTKSSLPRPDFSTLEKKERTLEFKEPGSYKKAKVLFPKSPLKSPKKNYITPNSCSISNFRSNLFFGNENNDETMKPSACRKLNFFDEKEKNEKSEKNNKGFIPGKVTSSFSLNSKKPANIPITNFLDCLKEENDDEEKMISTCNSPTNFDKNYLILRTISQDSQYNELFKSVEIATKKVVAIKKTKKKAPIKQIIKFLKTQKEKEPSLFSHYLLNPLSFWTETDQTSYKTTLFISEAYYDNGDILDYLSKLEQIQSPKLKDASFYFDLFFDMLCGVYFLHDYLNYIHFNVQPSNFLIDDNGHACLTGMSHARRFDENFDDLVEGDSAYIAPEIFNQKNLINYKSDIFSLGLSFLEIMSKLELPENGEMWRDIRSKNFTIPHELYDKWNVKNDELLNLIQTMIKVDNDSRPTIKEILENEKEFPEINKRFVELVSGDIVLKEEEERYVKMEDIDNYGMLSVKRSNSYKFDFSI